jgi:thioester reductase-like protein
MASRRHDRATEADIDGLLQSCIQMLPSPRILSTPTEKKCGLHIVLTGSTSTIGLHFVRAWLTSTHVRRITCLDRKAGAAERLAPLLGLLGPEQRDKVQFLQAQVAQPHFGLSHTGFQTLDDADVFVHNAWPVNYALPLSAFKAQLVGIARNLCNWAVNCPSNPRIVFTSSYMCVNNYQAVDKGKQTPESIVNAVGVCHGDGYSASKLVAERLLGEAQQRCGVPVSILRLGQISGAIDIPVDASRETIARFFTWSRREWLYMYLISSQNLGLLAEEGHRVHWIPVDSLAAIILELIVHDTASRETKPLTVYNLTNRPVRWSQLVPTIAKYIFSTKKPGKIVSHEEWIAPLRKLDRSSREHVQMYPVIRMLPLIELLAASEAYSANMSCDEVFEKEQTLRASPTMRTMQPMNPHWMRHYLAIWGFADDSPDGLEYVSTKSSL